MIISHRHRFVFVKTAKTAGTSLKVALASLCGDDDVVPPTMEPRPDLVPRNHLGWANPIPELRVARRAGIDLDAVGTRAMVLHRKKFGGHTPAWVIRLRAPKAWSDYTTFCVERDPWEKVVSGLSWVRTQYDQDWDVDTYLDFVEDRIHRGYHGTGVSPYNLPSYTDPLTGEVIVDRILRYERLTDDLDDLTRELGLPDVELPRVYGDRRRAGAAAEVLSRAQIDRVAELFAPEIELHGYRPPMG